MEAVIILRILWCTQNGDHPKNDLAKIWPHARYESKKKPESFLYFWLPTGTYHKKLVIWNFFSFEIWRIWAKISMKNPLVKSKSYFPGQNLA
jgi:hypothetical protein